MNRLPDMIWIEMRKAIRSRMPLFTLLGYLLLPLVGAFMMIILKDPELARRTGLISAKANIVAGSADWPSFLSMIAMGISIGGFVLFSLIASWVFGREFVDHTVLDLLAVPVPRVTILLAKFVVVMVWCLGLTVIVYAASLVAGALVGLPGGSAAIIWQASLRALVTAGMAFVVVTPVVLLASMGRGYLLPLGCVFLVIAITQVVAFIGYGEYFPWAIPSLYAGVAGEVTLGAASYWIVALTGLAGMAATWRWWQTADQNR